MPNTKPLNGINPNVFAKFGQGPQPQSGKTHAIFESGPLQRLFEALLACH